MRKKEEREDLYTGFQNAYGVDKFVTVKCTRCKHVMKTGGTGSGFCPYCDGSVFGRAKKDVSVVLIRQAGVIPAPAEWVK